MKKIFLTTLLTLFLFTFLVAPAFAQITNIWEGTTGEIGGEQTGTTCNVEGSCDWCDALKVTSNIVDFLTTVAFSLVALFIVIGGIMMAISGGNEQRFSAGKSYLTNAVTGLIITLGAWLLINTVLNILAPDYAADGIMPWNEIDCSEL